MYETTVVAFVLAAQESDSELGTIVFMIFAFLIGGSISRVVAAIFGDVIGAIFFIVVMISAWQNAP